MAPPDISVMRKEAQLRGCLPPPAAHAHNRPHSSSQVIIVDQDYGGGGSPSSFNNADYHQQVSFFSHFFQKWKKWTGNSGSSNRNFSAWQSDRKFKPNPIN